MPYTFINEAHDFSYTSGIPVLTLSGGITKGNLLIAWCTSTDSASSNTPWADGGYDMPWQPVIQQVYTGGYGYLSVWWCIAQRTRAAKVQFFGAPNPVASGGNGSVPANLTQAACQVLQFSGNGQVPFLAFHAASGTDTSPRSTVTAGAGVGLIVGISVPPTITNLATETAGWTNAAGASVGSSAIYALESGAGTYTPTFSLASSAEWGAFALAFAVPASTSTISGSIGRSGNVQFISQTTLVRQSATTDGAGNYTSPALENDTYTVIPQAVGAYYSPYSASQVISGSNITGANFSPNAVSTSLSFATHWVDTMVRANENPLSDGGFWHINGTPVPPWDAPLQLLSNEGTFSDTTIYSNLAGPWKADAINVWVLRNGVPSDQWMELQIDALNADPFSYATAYVEVRSGNSNTFCYRLAIQNNGDGTAMLAFISNPLTGVGGPPDWELNGHQNYGIVTVDVPFSLGDTIRLAIVGPVLYMYHNEALVGTANDTNISSGTFCIELTGKATADVQVSHFLGGTVSVMPNYTQLVSRF